MFGKTIVEKDFHGKKFKEYLKKKLRLSHKTIISLKQNHGTCVNGVVKKVNKLLVEGDVITLNFPVVVESEILSEEMDLEIAFEDKYIIVVNKKAGIPVHPCRNYQSGTLANGLMHRFKTANERATIHPVTRLDRNTSGLTLFAKDPHIQHLLNLEEYKSRFIKEYIAFIEGEMVPDQGFINLPIDRLEEGKIRRGVVENGAPSITEYKTLKKTGIYSEISVILHTGRTHQIRVHFSHLGHPLLGDDIYGGDCTLISRQALHAKKLTFIHPITDKEIVISSEMPEDMEALEIIK